MTHGVDWPYRAGDEHHESCNPSDYDLGEHFALNPDPFVSVDLYRTCGHRLTCKHCGGATFTIVIVPGGYWTGALCDHCGFLDCIHSG